MVKEDMETIKIPVLRVTPASPGVKVVTLSLGFGRYITEVHGGPLNEHRWEWKAPSRLAALWRHEKAVQYVGSAVDPDERPKVAHRLQPRRRKVAVADQN